MPFTCFRRPDRTCLLFPLVYSLTILYLSLYCAQPLLAQPVEYDRDVRPILSENCFACHGFDKAKREAGLRLDTSDGAVELLDSGKVAVQPGKPDESELIQRIFLSVDDSEQMPPHESGKQLSEFQKGVLKKWIAQGAVYDKHWAFIVPKKPELPNGEGLGSLAPIDRFVRDTLHRQGLTASPEADPVTLVRRFYLDLVGLPPTISEVDAFISAYQANADVACKELADRLLLSPHYGERWGRWWLDQARYADSNGYSVDAPRDIWKYRDWVVAAFHHDMPFDQFTIEQLAGDLLPNATDDEKIATGFHRNTPINQEGGIDPEQYRIDSVFDRVATTGTVWLGLTVGCAQCHDHKFDPIEQKEYYRLFAFFNNQDEPNLILYDPQLNASELLTEQGELEKLLSEAVTEYQDATNAWEEGLTDETRKGLSDDTIKVLAVPVAKRNASHKRRLVLAGPGAMDDVFRKRFSRSKELEKLLAKGISTMVMKEREKPRKTNVFIQGDFTRLADEVKCGTPSVLHPMESDAETLNRLDLARWLVSKKNPLTARVIVNRVWQNYFGRGLVETENDFGLQSSPPSHGELLDWMAVDFIERGWSLKELHRQIVMSKTYRQSSAERPDLRDVDRGNYLLARQRRLRLDGELVRDIELAACGLLSDKLGGPPVFPPIPAGVMERAQVKREWKVSSGEDRFRRGLYTFVYRANPPPSLNVFDTPEGNSTCTRRIRSNTPLQALTLLNDSSFFEFATALAKVIQADGLEVAFRRCVARHPRPDEIEVLKTLEPLSAARVLLNLDETLTRE